MYEKTFKLKDNEVPAKVNTETGEITELKSRPNNLPNNKEKFDYDEAWTKSYERSWSFLLDNLKPHEIKIALKMSTMTEYSTNSLVPLDDDAQLNFLSETFNVGKNQIKKSLTRLMDIGVYASFRYGHYKRGIVTEWVFNPFISFKGKLVDSDLKNLFANTPVGKHFLKESLYKI